MVDISMKAGSVNVERGILYRTASGMHIFYTAKEVAVWKIKNQPFFYKGIRKTGKKHG